MGETVDQVDDGAILKYDLPFSEHFRHKSVIDTDQSTAKTWAKMSKPAMTASPITGMRNGSLGIGMGRVGLRIPVHRISRVRSLPVSVGVWRLGTC